MWYAIQSIFQYWEASATICNLYTNIDILNTKGLKQSQYGAYKLFSKLILRICKDFKGICIFMLRFACPMFRRKRIVRCMYHLYIPYINVVYHTKHIPILGSIRNDL